MSFGKIFKNRRRLRLERGEVAKNRKLYGENVFEKAKRKNIFKKILSAFSEPMILILIFALVLTVGTGIGKSLKTGEKDFSGAIGVASAILISVGITLFMEGSSEKAFEKLKKEYSDAKVKVIRNGRADEIEESKLVVGDLVCIEDGSKVFADGGAEVFFPNLDELPAWQLVEQSEPINDNGYTIRFTTYKNNNVTKY